MAAQVLILPRPWKLPTVPGSSSPVAPCHNRLGPPSWATSGPTLQASHLVRVPYVLRITALQPGAPSSRASLRRFFSPPVASPLGRYYLTLAPSLSHHDHQRRRRRRSTLLLLLPILPRRLHLHRPPPGSQSSPCSQRPPSRAAAAATEAFGFANWAPALTSLQSRLFLVSSLPPSSVSRSPLTQALPETPHTCAIAIRSSDSTLPLSTILSITHHLPPHHHHPAAFFLAPLDLPLPSILYQLPPVDCLPPAGTRRTATPEAYQARRLARPRHRIFIL